MKPTKTAIDAAASAVADGHIIAYPTEGVFGLGCDPRNETAVNQLIALKDRSAQKGLILIAANREQLVPFLTTLSMDTEQRLTTSWPGPVTFILPAATTTKASITGGRNTIAARVTAHRAAADLCTACGHALVSTSANISGAPPCISADQVRSVFPEISFIVDLPIGDLHGPTPIFDGVSGTQLR